MTRETETETITHDGEEFEITYEPVHECEHCGYNWTTRSAARRPTCPSCQRKTDRHVSGGYYEYLTRHAMLTFTDDTDVTGELVVEVLRYEANKFEAMLANGWELLGTGGKSSIWMVKGDVEMEAPIE
jgi:ribosomal protein L37AE/L43A